MKIVLLNDWFSEEMGYIDNNLPKALAKLGHDVHLITSNCKPYYNASYYHELYEPFLGPGVVEPSVRSLNGFTVHRLPYAIDRNAFYLPDLIDTLRALKPDVVQAIEIQSRLTKDAAQACAEIGYLFYLETHVHASVFPMLPTVLSLLQSGALKDILRQFRNRYHIMQKTYLIRSNCIKCYAISTDCAQIIIQYYGFPKNKIELCPLGVDTDLFHLPNTADKQAQRNALRQQLGFTENEIVCIYTGRFTEGKDPLCLARAIGELRAVGAPFRGLFVGNGPLAYTKSLQQYPGCIVHPFVLVNALPAFYWAADIGVWPRQESTSQLDAMACGLPLILSNHVLVTERTDGTAVLYREGDSTDLARALRDLTSSSVRQEMGDRAALRIAKQLSWDILAQKRANDYAAAFKR